MSTTEQGKKGIDIDVNRDKRTAAELREAEVRITMQRDGWREIAEAMLTTAFGVPMKGHGDVPPIELLDAVRDKSEDQVIDALSAGVLGRAWRIAGADGEGKCDYPLCAHRDLDKAKRPQLKRVELRKAGEPHPTARLSVCAQDASAIAGTEGECAAWARWVASRFAQGRIVVTR